MVTGSGFEKFAMAAVGMNWVEAIKTCPEDVYPACHNSETSVTISGKKEKVDAFVDSLQKQGKFAKGVKSCGIAFHSPFVAAASETLREKLKEVRAPVKKSK